MINVRIAALALLGFASGFPASAQSVVSTHSGVVYFFTGTVFVGDQRLEQRFGRFPDVAQGSELRTETGRAEVLLTPGVILRVAENSSIRMISNKLSDTQVELLTGSAIVESNEPAKDTAVTLIHKKWQMHLAKTGVYRVDATPPHVESYKGEVEVKTAGLKDPVTVKEGDSLPLADVLLTEESKAPDADSFKTWAMNRSQAVAADNATAAEIIDDPSQFDNATSLAWGGFTYFPPTGMPSLGIGNPYGLSFWSPYQSTLTAMWNPIYLYGGYLPVYGGYGIGIGHGSRVGWPVGVHPYPSTPIYTSRPGYTRPISPTWHPGVGVTSPRPVYSPPHTFGHPVPSVGGHVAGHR